ncbi:hypothetical protein C2G38_2243164 [Gigaspora rosea]|uniref:Uncharacterized protein n=1 Tax=Gigaspora rosea TaxID=44941 RepID=A0A397VRV2_9GLOM|nr:hypothetical protein C2G38_2243164 [Gigaspora rosea]
MKNLKNHKKRDFYVSISSSNQMKCHAKPDAPPSSINKKKKKDQLRQEESNKENQEKMEVEELKKNLEEARTDEWQQRTMQLLREENEGQQRTIRSLREANEDLRTNYEGLLDLYWNNILTNNNIAN